MSKIASEAMTRGHTLRRCVRAICSRRARHGVLGFPTGVNAVPITIDRSEFPIIVVKFRGAPTLAEFETYLAGLDQIYAGGQRFSLIIDSIGAEAPPATQRKLQADWIRDHQPQIRKYNAGTGFVMDSVVLRGSLTAILWLQPLPCPHFVCAELGEAKKWARARLAEIPRQTNA